MKRLIILIFLWVVAWTGLSQTINTEGNDFWFGFMNNWLQDPDNPIILEVYISADDSTQGVIDIPLSTWGPQNFEVVPGVATRILIPTSEAQAVGSGFIENKGIHITSDNRVSVYAMNKRQYSADMTVILPTLSLGKEYRVMSHWEDGNRHDNSGSHSEFLIAAVADSTEIEIIPSYTTTDGRPADMPFTIIIDKGQVYQIQADGDLTGTMIRAVGGQSGCQNFAVFGGNRYTKVGQCDHPNGHDHLYSQMYPVNTWGKEFTMIPFKSRSGGDVIKVLAAEDNTTIDISGSIINLNAGEYEQLLLEGVKLFRADKPITVGHFSRSQACDGSTSDPFLITVSPNEQLLRRVTFNAPTIATVDDFFLNVLTPAKAKNELKLDGKFIGNQLKVVPGNSEYVFAQLTISRGNHTLQSREGFIAYVYGYGRNESFGYATGASLENLRVEIEVTDGSVPIPEDSICKNSEVFFVPQADTVFSRFYWDFGDGTTMTTDSAVSVSHTFDREGEYLIELVAKTPGGDCAAGNEERSLKKIQVVSPHADILGPRSVCPHTAEVAYAGISEGNNTYSWFAEGGNVYSPSRSDSVVIDWGDTNPEALVGVIPTNPLGCVGDTVSYPVKINIQLEPEAPFGPDSLCSSMIDTIGYETYFIKTSKYNWEAENGIVKTGNGTSQVEVSWDSYGWGKLWFTESSELDSVCAGASDTLQVFIERYPDLQVQLSIPDSVEIGERFDAAVIADSLYTFYSWSFGDGNVYDTLKIGAGLSHTYNCQGEKLIDLFVFDTLGICRGNTGIQRPIFVKEPVLEIINVTNDLYEDSTIILNWKSGNMHYYDKPIAIRRTDVDPSGGIAFKNEMKDNPGSWVHYPVPSHQYIYEFEVIANDDCPEVAATLEHRNIRLQAEKDESEDVARLNWNEYINWKEGVEHYEVWIQVDNGNISKLAELSADNFEYQNQNVGFEVCFRIRALERGGNKAVSWSNSSCVSFYPELITYNIFSPNGDGYNETFVIDRIELYPGSVLTIFNRYGKKVRETVGYDNTWDGRINGKPLPTGIYYWTLELNEPRVEIKSMNGYVQIVR